MPIIEVSLNDKRLAIGGGDDFDVLTFGFLDRTATDPASVQLTGWRKSTDEHLQWFHMQLRNRSQLRLVLRRHGAATPPLDSKNPPQSEVEGGSLRVATDPGSSSGFSVKIGEQMVRASGQTNPPLQATVTWHRLQEYAMLEIGSPDAGHINEGRFWFECRVRYDEVVELRL
jgi:hypothetical protein